MEYPKYTIEATSKVEVRKDVYHTFRQLNLDDMRMIELKYPDVIITRRSGDVESNDDKWKVDLLVYDRVIIEVTGINQSEKNWKEKIAIEDRIKVAHQAQKFKVFDAEEFQKDYPNLILDIPNHVEYCVGKLGIDICPIVFIFKDVQPEYIERFKKVASLSQKLKKNKVVWKSKATADVLIDLFDSLIEKVTGYQTADESKPFTPTMTPPQHKIKVINMMFPTITGQLEDFEGN